MDGGNVAQTLADRVITTNNGVTIIRYPEPPHPAMALLAFEYTNGYTQHRCNFDFGSSNQHWLFKVISIPEPSPRS